MSKPLFQSTTHKHGEVMDNHDLYTLEASLVNKSVRELANGEDKDPITKLRLLCLSRGASGIIGMGRVFRHVDDNGSKVLTAEEFSKGIREFGLDLCDDEIEEMFKSFDEDGSGSIDMTEFLLKLRPPMPQCRLDIIDQAFAKMDKSAEGVITVNDLKNVYSVKDCHLYQSGEMTAAEILKAFMDNFDGGRINKDGMITKEEFENYYAAISASIDNDLCFDLMIRRAYAL